MPRPSSRVAAERAYYDRNKDTVKARAKAWAANNPRGRLAVILRRRFGIGIADYDAMLARQGGCCAICQSELRRGNYKAMPHVDHCHGTTAVRGILCGGCNRALGLLSDDPARCERAARYLRAEMWPFIAPDSPPVAPRSNERRRVAGPDKRYRITEDQVRGIRRAKAAGQNGPQIAKAFGVSLASVHNILNGHSRLDVRD